MTRCQDVNFGTTEYDTSMSLVTVAGCWIAERGIVYEVSPGCYAKGRHGIAVAFWAGGVGVARKMPYRQSE